jgi:hypothetical protein
MPPPSRLSLLSLLSEAAIAQRSCQTICHCSANLPTADVLRVAPQVLHEPLRRRLTG